jgi:hypothetical protein
METELADAIGLAGAYQHLEHPAATPKVQLLKV